MTNAPYIIMSTIPLTLNHAIIARCMQTISYPAAEIQQDNDH